MQDLILPLLFLVFQLLDVFRASALIRAARLGARRDVVVWAAFVGAAGLRAGGDRGGALALLQMIALEVDGLQVADGVDLGNIGQGCRVDRHVSATWYAQRPDTQAMGRLAGIEAGEVLCRESCALGSAFGLGVDNAVAMIRVLDNVIDMIGQDALLRSIHFGISIDDTASQSAHDFLGIFSP
ncbi:hypothetical protein Tdes44962_MAKER02191 [Teratosphaeria destructans]|uniref:Secreted protein n=1 Tax=Teratosphaeria destructans TaxID=418781 RepID=A0A9W7W3L4_9PEZI|nr:hypothetical protein Tdes44962_MAKER02191 [Teratosphaeria destructans]